MKTTATLFKREKDASGNSLPEELLAALRKVLPEVTRTYPLHEPSFSGREWEYVKDCIDTGMVEP